MRTFFQDKDGNQSMMRLIAFECVQAGVVIALYGAYKNEMELLAFAGTLIMAGFTGKYVQKGQEAK